jgi:membrane protein
VKEAMLIERTDRLGTDGRTAGEKLTTYLAHFLWLPTTLTAIPVAATRFVQHRCVQWAAALAYTTLIGLVPLLAALFALLKGLGLHHELTPFVMNTIGAGSPRVTQQIVEFIDKTNVRAVAVFSIMGALLATFGILTNAELCFNDIWGGVLGRPFRHKLKSFGKVVLLAPLLLVLALGLTALLRPGTRTWMFFDAWYLGDAILWFLTLLPYALLWAACTVLYTGLPNTEVRTGAAVAGAVVAGTLWQLAQFAYVSFVIGIVRYSKVYGALWQLPILLAWTYVAWTIILFGGEVSRAHHEVTDWRVTRYRLEPQTPDTERDG